jgi:hypothetical protein
VTSRSRKRRPLLIALLSAAAADLAFDWTHDERSQEGVVADLTFVGRRLVKVDLHPAPIIAGQPNLLDPAGDGQVALAPAQKSSEPRLGW